MLTFIKLKMLNVFKLLLIVAIVNSSFAFKDFRISGWKCMSKESLFLTLYGRSLTECVQECGNRPKCEFLNYRRHGTRACELMAIINKTAFTLEACIFIHRSDIHFIPTDCGGSCTTNQMCDTDRNICSVQECKPLDAQEGVTLFGNMKTVGSRLKILCDQGSSSAWMFVNCTTTGNWNPIPDQFSKWSLAFKGVSDNGIDPALAWMGGEGLSTDNPCCGELTVGKCVKHYRNNHIASVWSSSCIKKVRYSLFKNNREVAHIDFNGTDSDIQNWFSKERILHSSWADVMKQQEFNVFSILGRTPSRRFLTNVAPYAGCQTDSAYTVTLTSGHYRCLYDIHNAYPKYMYAEGDTYGVMETMLRFDIADFMSIRIKYC